MVKHIGLNFRITLEVNLYFSSLKTENLNFSDLFLFLLKCCQFYPAANVFVYANSKEVNCRVRPI